MQRYVRSWDGTCWMRWLLLGATTCVGASTRWGRTATTCPGDRRAGGQDPCVAGRAALPGPGPATGRARAIRARTTLSRPCFSTMSSPSWTRPEPRPGGRAPGGTVDPDHGGAPARRDRVAAAPPGAEPGSAMTLGRRDNGPRRLGDSMPRCWAGWVGTDPGVMEAVFTRWDELVGTELGGHLRPQRVDGVSSSWPWSTRPGRPGPAWNPGRSWPDSGSWERPPSTAWKSWSSGPERHIVAAAETVQKCRIGAAVG